ncbi:gfo/Idh/MocA family oxidoreductase [Paenibacillaceae bacterium]|nr:gfo/Idh/MocA family oxidoreductase [Paenibacillaceae bacterium]
MTRNQTINWGILGPGSIAHSFVKDLHHVADAKVVAVGSRTLDNAERFAKQHHIAKAYGSYASLIEDAEVDIIYIATPHAAHAANMLACLRAGKAVLCEKPFTMNGQEAEEIVHYAKQAKVFLMEAMWTRFLPAVVQARKWIDSGRIGEVRMLTANFGFRAHRDESSRLFDPRLGGGALLEVGIYPISFASMMFGQAPAAIATHAHIGATGIDEHFSALFTYSEGRTAVLNSSIGLHLANDAYIYGTDGYIHLPVFLAAQSASLYVNGAFAETFVYEGAEAGYAFEAAEATRCLQAGLSESSIMPLDETLQIMQTLDAVKQQWNALQSTPSHPFNPHHDQSIHSGGQQ